jgi:hypothetical protein
VEAIESVSAVVVIVHANVSAVRTYVAHSVRTNLQRSQMNDTVKSNLQLLFSDNPKLKDSSYNQILFSYWKRFDRFGDVTLEPDEITNYLSIDRAIRDLRNPTNENLQKEQSYRQYYGNKEKQGVSNI